MLGRDTFTFWKCAQGDDNDDSCVSFENKKLSRRKIKQNFIFLYITESVKKRGVFTHVISCHKKNNDSFYHNHQSVHTIGYRNNLIKSLASFEHQHIFRPRIKSHWVWLIVFFCKIYIEHFFFHNVQISYFFLSNQLK